MPASEVQTSQWLPEKRKSDDSNPFSPFFSGDDTVGYF
jgi:hypothetical protein